MARDFERPPDGGSDALDRAADRGVVERPDVSKDHGRLDEEVEGLAWLLVLRHEQPRLVGRWLCKEELDLVTCLRERSHPLAQERERLADDLSVPLGRNEVPKTSEEIVLAQLADP